MPLPAGTRLGSLEIVRPLGAGGMGEVYLARDIDLNRSVAVKVLPAEVTSDPQRVARFEQEARAASALNDPNVCVVHALGRTDDGRRFIAMEHVEGETLRARLARGRIPLAEALDIAIQIASALTAAHAAGIVHRDIKPENVVIRRDRLVKVLDFGLAKLTAPGIAPGAHEPTRTLAVTDPGALVGTVGYMSPEQARGTDVDSRADVWALGVVLYEMIAGRPPFTGATRSDVLVAILDRDPLPLAALLPGVPGELQRIAGKTLRKDPERRYQGMKDLLLDLQSLREEIRTPAESRVVRTRRTRGRSARTWMGGAALLLVIAAVLGAIWWLQPAPPAADDPVDRPLRRVTFEPGLQTDVAFSPDGRSIAFASDRTGNFDIWVQALDGGDAQQVTRSPAQERQPGWSPDGRRLVFRSEGDPGGLFVVPIEGGVARHLSSFGMHPQWSADGAEVIFRSGYGDSHYKVHSVSPEGGEAPREVLRDFLAGGEWQWIAPHPDGRISVAGVHPERRFGFFTVSRDGRQVTASTFAEDLPLQWTEMGTRLLRFQWNSAGSALYVEAALNDVRNLWRVRVDPATLAWLSAERLTIGAGPDVAAALSPDGTRIAYSAQQESVRLWSFPLDPASGRIQTNGKPFTPEGAGADKFAVSPDGRFAAYVLRRPGSTRFDAWLTDIDVGTSEMLGEQIMPGAWSRDSRTLAYALSRPDRPPPGEWALAVREIGGPERILSGWSAESALLPSDWTPDGRAILGSHIEPLFTGRARLVVRPLSPPGPDRVLVDDPERVIWQGTFSPDGRWLSFVAQPRDDRDRIEIAIAPADGAPRDRWIRVAPDHAWCDKPRWAPDGRTLYFLSSEGASFFNVWAVRFDPERGRLAGEPFMATNFDSPGLMISPLIGTSELGISERRAVLTMASVTGSIWLLEGVDR